MTPWSRELDKCPYYSQSIDHSGLNIVGEMVLDVRRDTELNAGTDDADQQR